VRNKTVIAGLILALFSGLSVFAQGAAGVLITFSPQGRIAGFDAHAVRICNTTDVPANFHSAIVRNAAAAEKLKPASYTAIQQELTTRNRLGPIRIMATVAEIVGWGMSVAVATDALWQGQSGIQRALPSIVAGSLRLATTVTAEYNPEEKTPGDLLPVFVQVPAGCGSCVEYTMLAFR